MRKPVDPGKDRFGQIEEAGVEYIPEEARDSSPRNVFAVLVGAQFSWTVVIFGWLPIALGLDFWSALISNIVGMLIGVIIMVPVAIIGPRTGTNMTVASSAFFGIRGRLIGSALALTFAIVFAAMTVWTSGDAIVAAGGRLLNTPDNNWAKAISYAVVSIGIVAVAIYGHATIVAMQKFIIPVVGFLLVLGIFAYAPQFDPNVRTAEYALGGYWQTWILSMVLAIAGPISFVTMVGDYTRRVPQFQYSNARTGLAVAGGLFVGNMFPYAFGMFTAVVFTNPSDSYIDDLVGSAPGWYVLPIVLIAIIGGCGQGVMNIYASGLDLEGLFPRLRRVQTTIIAATIAIVILYGGIFLVHAVDWLTAMTLAVNGVAVPWAVVMIIGSLRQRTKGYDPVDLQAFAQGRRGGRYWFTAGWNIRAVLAWLTGSVFGVLAVNCQLYVGPFANLAGGVDLSCVGSGLITAVVYIALQGFSSKREVPQSDMAQVTGDQAD